jgi:hypothetical protein
MGVKNSRWPLAPEERFWRYVNKTTPDLCWEWQGPRNHAGYGILKLGQQTWLATRLLWTWMNGPIVEGMCVLHHCDNPACVNPAHLWLGTRADNNADKYHKGRHRVGIGERARQAKLTASAVKWIREAYQGGMSQTAIAQHLGVNQTSISRVVLRQTWRHIP